MTVHPLHAHLIGGSEAAAAAGIDPHLSAAMLWVYKTGRDERPESEAMKWGKLLEPVVYAELDALGYATMPMPAEGYRDPERAWCVGHPDGWVDVDGERGLLEIKTTGYFAHRAADNGDGALPIAHEAQMQWYFHLAGLQVGVWACLIGGQRLEVRTVERNQDAIDALLHYAAAFHDCLVRDEPPGFDRDALRAIFPTAEPGRKVRAGKALMETVYELRLAHEQEDAAKARKAELEDVVKAFMGDAEVLVSPSDYNVAKWVNTTSTTLDRKKLEDLAPVAYADTLVSKPTRRFTLL